MAAVPHHGFPLPTGTAVLTKHETPRREGGEGFEG